jgi:rare lipoprotein A
MVSFKNVALARACVSLVCALLLSCSSSPRFIRSGGENSSGRETARNTHDTVSTAPVVRPSSGRILLTLEGVASYYADAFHGKLTSNGETFDMNAQTAAHRTFPFGTKIKVTNLANGKTVVVRVNDRGPFVEGRIIDLALGAAKVIDLVQTGTGRVRLEVLEWGDGR